MQAAWEAQLQQLAAHLAAGNPLSPALRRWRNRQRRMYFEGELAPDRVEALEELPGFRWSRGLSSRLTRSLPPKPPVPPPPRVGGEGTVVYGTAKSVGRALLMSVGRRRGKGAAQELEDAREALLQLGYSVFSVENPSAAQLEAALDAHRQVR